MRRRGRSVIMCAMSAHTEPEAAETETAQSEQTVRPSNPKASAAAAAARSTLRRQQKTLWPGAGPGPVIDVTSDLPGDAGFSGVTYTSGAGREVLTMSATEKDGITVSVTWAADNDTAVVRETITVTDGDGMEVDGRGGALEGTLLDFDTPGMPSMEKIQQALDS